jgi:hypothetical protein
MGCRFVLSPGDGAVEAGVGDVRVAIFQLSAGETEFGDNDTPARVHPFADLVERDVSGSKREHGARPRGHPTTSARTISMALGMTCA